MLYVTLSLYSWTYPNYNTIKQISLSRKRELPLLEKVKITDIGSEGNAVARVKNLVVFTPMLIPGDVVDIQVTRKRRKYLEGIPVRFHEYSKDRINPVCSHFGICGGCKWQHLPYDKQLYFKRKQVVDNLCRIGKLELPEIRPVIGSGNELLYRNKLEYTFSSRRWLTREEILSSEDITQEKALGFHIPGLFDKVLNINYCHLQPEPTNSIRNAVREFTQDKKFEYYDYREQKGYLRNLIIRNSLNGEVMVIVVFHHSDIASREELLDFIHNKFPEITSLMYIVNPKRNESISDLEVSLYRGKDYITESIDGLVFRIGPKSFYQTNTGQAMVLYRKVKDFAALTGKDIVYDLYTGTGTIANYVADAAEKVIGIEYIDSAIRDAETNSGLNGIKNTLFFSGDIKDILSERFFRANGFPDVIITDPPRAGMHGQVVRSILSAAPSRIVYVSCNPATQARDLQLLEARYRIAAVQPVDMFPQTHHIENIVLLLRK
jgi:23S rRNA (uracil1939-C5)-methyltransferase